MGQITSKWDQVTHHCHKVGLPMKLWWLHREREAQDLRTHLPSGFFQFIESPFCKRQNMGFNSSDFLQVIGGDSAYYFHEMIDEMISWGYKEAKTLFGFGYDFRQSNRLVIGCDFFLF